MVTQSSHKVITRPVGVDLCKKPMDLSASESEECGYGKGVGVYDTLIQWKGGGMYDTLLQSQTVQQSLVFL